jgi:Helix-turn-helix domain
MIPESNPKSPTPPFSDKLPRSIIPWGQFLGSMVPNWLMRRLEISQGAKLAYGRLAQYAGRDGRCFPMQETLGKELGVGERMARNYIRELESFRLIETVQNGKGTSNHYLFLDHPWMHEGNVETNCRPDRQKPSSPDQQMNSVPISEENQSLRESKKQEHTDNTVYKGIPSSPEEAIIVARQLGIEEAFAIREFHTKEAVGWKDGYGNSITSWRDHLQARWPIEQRKRAERRAVGKRPPSPQRQFNPGDYNQSLKDF